MQLFLERLIYFWAGITAIGLLIAVAYWALATIIYVAFISSFYHYHHSNPLNLQHYLDKVLIKLQSF